MTVLLTIALAVVALEACVAVALVYWTRQRPARMMRWAVRRRAAMTPIESLIWLQMRRARRTMVQLRITIHDELSPALAHLQEAMEGFAEFLSALQENGS